MTLTDEEFRALRYFGGSDRLLGWYNVAARMSMQGFRCETPVSRLLRGLAQKGYLSPEGSQQGDTLYALTQLGRDFLPRVDFKPGDRVKVIPNDYGSGLVHEKYPDKIWTIREIVGGNILPDYYAVFNNHVSVNILNIEKVNE